MKTLLLAVVLLGAVSTAQAAVYEYPALPDFPPAMQGEAVMTFSTDGVSLEYGTVTPPYKAE